MNVGSLLYFVDDKYLRNASWRACFLKFVSIFSLKNFLKAFLLQMVVYLLIYYFVVFRYILMKTIS